MCCSVAVQRRTVPAGCARTRISWQTDLSVFGVLAFGELATYLDWTILAGQFSGECTLTRVVVVESKWRTAREAMLKNLLVIFSHAANL